MTKNSASSMHLFSLANQKQVWLVKLHFLELVTSPYGALELQVSGAPGGNHQRHAHNLTQAHPLFLGDNG